MNLHHNLLLFAHMAHLIAVPVLRACRLPAIMYDPASAASVVVCKTRVLTSSIRSVGEKRM